MNLASFQFSSQLIVEDTAKSTFRVGDDGVTSIELLAGGVIVIRRGDKDAIVATALGSGLQQKMDPQFEADLREAIENRPKPPVKAKR